MRTAHWSFLTPIPFANTTRRELDEAFNTFFGVGNGNHAKAAFCLPLTIWEDDQRVYLQADVPGCDHEHLELNFKEGQLWISGERNVPKDDGKYRHNERMFGRFERAVSLPETIDADSFDAELDNGVLHVTIAKKPEAQPTKICIKTPAP